MVSSETITRPCPTASEVEGGSASGGSQPRNKPQGFTLIELMAVIVVIATVAAIGIKVSIYAQRKAAAMRTDATIAAIQTALELYKSDYGYYPLSTTVRVSSSGMGESTNNWLLYRALSGTCNGCGKHYLNLTGPQLHNHGVTGLTNLFDSYEMPFSYYNSPSTAWYVYCPPNGAANANTGYALGGQVNTKSYDLLSYGPNQQTYVPGLTGISVSGGSSWINGMQFPSAALDDIWYR